MLTALRALLVEDRPDDAEFMLRELRKSGFAIEATRVETEPEYLAQLAQNPHIILADYSLPQFSAPRALMLLQERAVDIPFIVVTGTISEESAVECMRRGASDYVLKERLARLGPAVIGALDARRTREEKRLAETALANARRNHERAHSQLRALVAAAPIGIAFLDENLCWVHSNEQMARIVGRSVGDHAGKTTTELLSKLSSQIDPLLRQVMRSGYPVVDREITGETGGAPGEVRTWLSTIYPVQSADQANLGVGMVLTDVTERKRADEALRAKEAQLRQAQKMEAVGQIASGIAHDINNLLTVIYGATSILRARAIEDLESAKWVLRIEDAAQQASHVTRGLLTFARAAPVAKRTIDVQAVIDRSLHFARRLMPASITLQIQRDTDQPIWVYADDTQLQQILLNLIINARDAMPDGGSISVGLSREAPAQAGAAGAPAEGFARITVRDTGIGIPPELQDRIFEPFFTTKPREHGTGLGLAITHAIVQDHDGKIEVQSAVGAGAMFAITLPCTLPEKHAAEVAPAAPELRGQGELILLAEDHQLVRELLQSALRSRGFEVLAVADGNDLLARFAEERSRVRVVVADLDLPGRSGLSCIEEIRRNNASIPIVLITGNITEALEEQFDHDSILLRKPFQVSELAQLVHRLIRNREHQEATP